MEADLQMIDSIHLFTPTMVSIGELSKSAGTLESCVMSLEINGDHSLSVVTTRHLEVGTRAVIVMDGGRYTEWVLDEVEQEHSDTEYGTSSYHFVWSIQYDFQSTNVGTIEQPGMSMDSGCTAKMALECAVKGTGWEVGVVSGVKTKSAVVMNYNSAWDRLDQVIRHWGGEVSVSFVIGDHNSIAGRRVNLTDHIGDRRPDRRLEWRHDLTSISRDPDPGPYFCRVIPLGNGESVTSDDGESTISEPLTIERVTGKKYLADEEVEGLFWFRDASGEYHYPTTTVSYSTDDDNELLTLAYVDLQNHTRPGVSYTGTVSQLVESGMFTKRGGVDLGDEVHIVDYGFNPEYPLVTQERVVKIEWDLVNNDDKKVTIGKFRQTLENTMAGMVSAVGIDRIEAITHLDLPTITIPDYSQLKIDIPNLEFDIPEFEIPEYEIPDFEIPEFDFSEWEDTLNELTDEFESRLDDIDALLAELTGITYDPETDTFYDANDNVIDTGSLYQGDTDTFVGDTTIEDLLDDGTFSVDDDGNIVDKAGNVVVPAEDVAAATGGITYVTGGDGWTHQINGVTYDTGTINFVTNGSGGGSGGGSSGSSSTKPSSTTKKTSWESNARTAALNLAKRLAENKAKKKDSTASKKKAKAKSNFAVTAANIATSIGINTNATPDTKNELFGKSTDDGNFIIPGEDGWLDHLFGNSGGGYSF